MFSSHPGLGRESPQRFRLCHGPGLCGGRSGAGGGAGGAGCDDLRLSWPWKKRFGLVGLGFRVWFGWVVFLKDKKCFKVKICFLVVGFFFSKKFVGFLAGLVGWVGWVWGLEKNTL